MIENDYCLLYDIASKRIVELEQENKELHKINCEGLAELKTENDRLIRKIDCLTEMNEGLHELLDDDIEILEKLVKARELLNKMYYLYYDPCVTNKDLENRDKLFEEVKQFLKGIEK